jgi:type II secretory pathway pseudopilin PulG
MILQHGPKMAYNKKGITIVEALVASIISAILMGAIVSFVSFSSRATDQINALQVLQQESSMISELFFRAVRNGNKVVQMNGGAEVEAGSTGINGASHIRVKGAIGLLKDIDFRIINNTLEIDDSANGIYRTASTRLCIARNPSSFNISPYSKGAQIELTLEDTISGTPYTYTTTLGGVRCQNSKE